MAGVNELFGGLPFLDLSFLPTRLLAVVARIRSILAEDILQAREAPSHWLDPDHALRLRMATGIQCDLEFEPLPTSQICAVEEARMAIIARMPAWRDLILLPVRYHRLSSADAIGCSCYATPQRVFLTDAAFSTTQELCEQIIHEHCHNWMYLVEEVMPFHRTDFRTLFTLPSGTPNRNPTEIIGAAHVTAALTLWYSMSSSSGVEERIRELTTYFRQCVEILKALPPQSLYPIGKEITMHLAALCPCRNGETVVP